MNFRMKSFYLSIAAALVLAVIALGCSSNSGSSPNQLAVIEPPDKSSVKSGDNSPSAFSIELTTEPGEISSNHPAKLHFVVKDPTGKVNPSLDIVHEKLMHLLVVSDDLAFFDHIHPEPDSEGKYSVETSFPSAGKYKLYADYTPKGTSQQIGRLEINVTGSRRERKQLEVDRQDTKSFGELRVTMKPDKPLKAGELIKLNFD
ncbi:MAG: hypothetical protein AB1489_16225 [Acidobacteriota bacterium]